MKLNVQILRAAKLAIATGLLSLVLLGCSPATLLSSYLSSSPKARQNYIDQYMKGSRNDPMQVYLLGEVMLYMDLDTYRSLIVDDETMLRYGLGLYLARAPELTYASFVAMLDGSARTSITEQDFNFYRRWGELFLDGLHSQPETAYLAEREALFRARFPRGSLVLNVNTGPGYLYYMDLIRDTERFEQFLTDDEYALSELAKILETGDGDIVRVKKESLGPIFTGVTPGTGS